MGSAPKTLRLNDGHVALLVIDMQNAAVHPNGTFGKLGHDTSPIQAIVPTIKTLVEAFQAKDIPTIFIKMGWAPDYSDAGLLATHGPGPYLKQVQGFIRDTWDTDIIDELKPFSEHRSALIFDKTRNSAFHSANPTSFSKALREKGTERLVVTGCLANACVDGTVRDAMGDGFPCVVPREATAAVEDRITEYALENMAFWADVVAAEEVMEALK